MHICDRTNRTRDNIPRSQIGDERLIFLRIDSIIDRKSKRFTNQLRSRRDKFSDRVILILLIAL